MKIDALQPTSPPPSLPLPWWLRPAGACVLIVLACVLTHGWMVQLEFQLDDWEQISDAMHPERGAVLLGHNPREKNAARGRPTFVAFYRPVLFASMWLDVQLFGSDTRGHHASSVVYHILCSLLFYLTLLRCMPLVMTKTRGKRMAAFILTSALLFAAHPGSWGAVSWVAARGDILGTLFFLLAVLMLFSLRQNPRWWKAPLLFLCLLLAVLAKEGALVCGPILALVDYFVFRHRQGDKRPWHTLLLDIPLVLIAPAYMYFRVLMFGEYANLYAGQVRVINFEIIKRMIEDFFILTPNLIGGYFYTVDLETDTIRTLGHIQRWLTIAMLVLTTLWILRKPVRRFLGYALLVVLYGVAVAPALRFFREACGFDATRLFYLPALFSSILMALPLQLLMARLKMLRRAALIWLLSACAVWGTGAFRHYSNQMDAAALIARVRQDIQAYHRAQSGEKSAFVVFMLPVEIGHVALYGTFLRYAFTEDFTDEPIVVHATWSEDLLFELKEGGLYRFPHPVQFLEWRDDSRDIGHLHAMTRVLPGLKGYHPRLKWPQNALELKLDPPIHPRDVKTLELEFAEAPTTDFAFKLIFEDETFQETRNPTDQDAASHTLEVNWKPGEFGSSAQVRFHFLQDPGWLFMGPVVKARIEVVSGTMPKITAINFEAHIPEIVTTIPDDRTYSIEGPEPAILFKETERCDWYRVRVFFGVVEKIWTFPRKHLHKRETGELEVRLSRGGFFNDEWPISWDQLKVYSISILDRQGIRETPFQYRIEGLRGQIDHQAQPQTLSRVARFLIVN